MFESIAKGFYYYYFLFVIWQVSFTVLKNETFYLFVNQREHCLHPNIYRLYNLISLLHVQKLSILYKTNFVSSELNIKIIVVNKLTNITNYIKFHITIKVGLMRIQIYLYLVKILKYLVTYVLLRSSRKNALIQVIEYYIIVFIVYLVGTN